MDISALEEWQQETVKLCWKLYSNKRWMVQEIQGAQAALDLSTTFAECSGLKKAKAGGDKLLVDRW